MQKWITLRLQVHAAAIFLLVLFACETRANDESVAQRLQILQDAIGEKYLVRLIIKWPDGSAEEALFFKDGEFSRAFRKRKDGTEVNTLVNSRYLANIYRENNGEWVLHSLALRGSPEFDKGIKAVRENDFVQVNFIDLRGIGVLSSHPQWVAAGAGELEKPLPPGTQITLRVEENIPETEYGGFLAGGEIRVKNEERNGEPVLVVTRRLPEYGEMTDEYVQWMQVRERLVPTKIVVKKDDKVFQTHEYDFSTIDRPLNRSECYLSFYGISEPGRPSSFAWTIGVGVVLGVLVLAGIVWRWRTA